MLILLLLSWTKASEAGRSDVHEMSGCSSADGASSSSLAGDEELILCVLSRDSSVMIGDGIGPITDAADDVTGYRLVSTGLRRQISKIQTNSISIFLAIYRTRFHWLLFLGCGSGYLIKVNYDMQMSEGEGKRHRLTSLERGQDVDDGGKWRAKRSFRRLADTKMARAFKSL